MLLDAVKAAGRFVWEYLIPHCETEDVASSGVERVRPALFIPGQRIEILAEAARLGGVQFLHTECSVAAMEVVMEILRRIES